MTNDYWFNDISANPTCDEHNQISDAKLDNQNHKLFKQSILM